MSVTNLDLLTYSGNLKNLTSIENDDRYKFVQGDICDRDLVQKLLLQCDAVVHFAAKGDIHLVAETDVRLAVGGVAHFVAEGVVRLAAG